MPDPTVPARPPQPVRLTADLSDLWNARSTVHVAAGVAFVRFGTTDVRLGLVGKPATVRQLLTDALTQLDAIEAGRQEHT